MLRDVAQVLEMAHKFERLHRDISAGDMYLAWRGLLGHSEHAKQIDDDTRKCRTGTYEFMPVGISLRSYVFAPVRRLGASTKFIARQLKQRMYDKQEQFPPLTGTAEFRLNPLHDLESLWWCATYTLLMIPHRVQVPDNPNGLAALEKTCSSVYFPSKGSHVHNRLRLPKDGDELLRAIINIPGPFKLFAPELLLEPQDLLNEHFTSAKPNAPDIDPATAGAGVHSEFIRITSAFPDILAHLELQESIPPLRDIGESTNIKEL